MPWIITKYPTACAECAQPLAISTHALYNPAERKIYCASCGFDVADVVITPATGAGIKGVLCYQRATPEKD